MAKAKQVHSWGDIPQEAFDAFYKAVEKLREEMIPRDGDGDHPIEISIVNRMTHEPLSYFAVPRDEVYSYITHDYLTVHPDKQQEMTDETERALTANLHMAAEALDRHMRLKLHHNAEEREAKKPFAERIKRACRYCAKNIPFKEADDLGSGQFRTKYPDYPLIYHVGDVGCEALGIRREQFNAAHPEQFGREEPRWCMNPNCRCKLPTHNSKKGVKDKNVCVNPRCGLDNSKHYPETVS